MDIHCIIQAVLAVQLLTYVLHLNLPANIQVYLKELNEAAGLKRMLFHLIGRDRAAEATAGLAAAGFGTLLVCKETIKRKSSKRFHMDNALEIWVSFQFIGLADTAIGSTNPLLLLFFASTWLSASAYFYKRVSKQECLGPLFL